MLSEQRELVAASASNGLGSHSARKQRQLPSKIHALQAVLARLVSEQADLEWALPEALISISQDAEVSGV